MSIKPDLRSRDNMNNDNEERFFDVARIKGAQKRYNVSGMNEKRLIIGFALVLLLFVLLTFRMGYWQIIRGDEMKERATNIQKIDADIASKRGTIYDTNGNVLAETVTKYELYVLSYNLYRSKELSGLEKEKNVKALAKITGMKEEDVIKKLSTKENQVLLCSGLTQKQVKNAQKRFEGYVYVGTKVTRNYPNGAFAAQSLGSVSDGGDGRSGLELEYNSTLSGINGRTVKTTDRDGNTVAGGGEKFYAADNGYNLVTTIDSVIQHYVEDALVKGMQRTGASSITCVVSDPKTGNILALAQTPEFDPNKANVPTDEKALAEFNKLSLKEKNDYLSKMWTIEAVSSVYEPGSTFKLVASSAALELGSADESSRYYCNGTINVDGVTLHCTGNHGTQNVKEAVGHSCNPALAKMALTMGSKGFYQYIKLYGLMNKTGIDLPGESGSIIKQRDSLTSVDLATMGYGQGIAITPIQLIAAVNAMGNDGVLMKPKVVKEITDEDGKVVETIGDTEVRQVITKETADKMREIMEYYVSDAGGDKAYVAGFRIGGKTGTANIASGGSYSSATDTSFIAMAPMDDPVISVLVIVHKPTKMSYGNNTAGPIIKEIMENSLVYMGVKREYTDTEAVQAAKNQVTTPDVTKLDSEKAIASIKSRGLKYKVVPENIGSKSFVVQDQYPKAGTKIQKGGTVYIYSR